MSHGVTMMILKKSRNNVNPEYLGVLKKRFDEKPKDDSLGSIPKYGEYPVLLDSETDTFDFLHSKTGIPYNIAFEKRFYSVTDGLRDYLLGSYGLSAYNPVERGTTIDRQTARKMFTAIQYLLLGHYDVEIEKLLNNEFIDVFSDMSGKYSVYRYRLMFPDDKEYVNDGEDSECVLESLRNMLGVFLETDEDDGVDGYELYFEVWG